MSTSKRKAIRSPRRHREGLRMDGNRGFNVELIEVTRTPSAPDILESAAMHIAERAKVRDIPGGERSMRRTVEAFNAIAGHMLTERDGWMFMAMLKAARAGTGAHNHDDYEDGAAYFALAGECAARRATP